MDVCQLDAISQRSTVTVETPSDSEPSRALMFYCRPTGGRPTQHYCLFLLASTHRYRAVMMRSSQMINEYHLGFEHTCMRAISGATLTRNQRVTPHNLQRRPKPPITRTTLKTSARIHTRHRAYGSGAIGISATLMKIQTSQAKAVPLELPSRRKPAMSGLALPNAPASVRVSK